MNVDMNNHIGAYHIDSKTGRWSIIGASNEMNEALNAKLSNNTFHLEEVMKDAVCLQVKGTLITSENYVDFRKPTGIMPKHCYGTTYGYQQNEKIEEKLKNYYLSQLGTKAELKDFFKDCCRDMRVILAQERKTTGMDIDNNRQIILDTYEIFRMANSVMASLGCSKEGEKLAREFGWNNGEDIDWVYYNADFYYQSEELRNIFKEAVEEIATEWECGDIDTSERDIDYWASYSSSFNEVWKNGSEYGARICRMIDISVKPPEGFYMFFRVSMEDDVHKGILQVGTEETFQLNKELIFDVFGIYDQHPQFYHLKDLLQNDSNDKTFEEYLDNFDIYTRYYGTAQMRKQ